MHTVDELRGFTLTLNGEAVDCDPTKNVEVHEVNPSDLVGYEGQPSTWTVLQSEFTENGVTGYQYVIHPDNGKTPSVTYRFFYDAPDPVDELAGVTATLDDGSPVTGFDPLNEEDIFTIPSGHTVTLGNLRTVGRRPARATTGAPPSHSPRRTEGASPTCSTSPTTTSGRM